MTHFGLRFGTRLCTECTGTSTQAFKPSQTLPQLPASLSMISQFKSMMTQKVIGKSKYEIDTDALNTSETDEFCEVIKVGSEYSLLLTYDTKGGEQRDQPRFHLEFQATGIISWLTYSRHRWITCIVRFFNGEDESYENDVYQCSAGEALNPQNGRLYMMDRNVSRIAVEVVITQRADTVPEEEMTPFILQQVRLYEDGKNNGDLTLIVITDSNENAKAPGSVPMNAVNSVNSMKSNDSNNSKNASPETEHKSGSASAAEGDEAPECKEDDETSDPEIDEPVHSLADDEMRPGVGRKGQDNPLSVEMRTHSAVLRSASSVFQSMLKHEMREKTEMVIEIHAAKTKDVDDLIYFIMTDQLRWDANPLRIIQLAHLYDLPALQAVCARRISDDVHVNTFVDSFNVFNRYEIQSGFQNLVVFGKENLWTLKQLGFLKELPFVFRFGILGARV